MGNFNRGGGRDFGRRGGFGGDRRGGFGHGDSGRREMFSAVCSNCGKECQIPFNPTSGRPVYCSECFEKINGGRDSRRPERQDHRSSAPSFDSKAQFDAINAKLDKILGILNPAPVAKDLEPVESVKEEKTDEVKEVKAEKPEKKVKKAASKKKE
jgi:CxxC-x17-CxxC domain-containing protein